MKEFIRNLTVVLLMLNSCGTDGSSHEDEPSDDAATDSSHSQAGFDCDQDDDGFIASSLKWDVRCDVQAETLDCDDDDSNIFPGAEEICDGRDNDCDGDIDDFDIHACPLSCKTPAGGCESVVKVVSGDDHFCALLSSGDVLCWGSNATGEIADLDLGYFAHPRRLTGISNARDIDIGRNLTCALVDEQVICWGDGIAIPYAITVGVNVTQIGVGDSRICTINTSGTVTCWSRDPSGFLLNSFKVLVDSSAMDLDGYGDQLCVLMSFGEVRCWNGDLSHLPIISGAEAIAVGPSLSCAVVIGKVSCWEPGGYPVEIEDVQGAVEIRLSDNTQCTIDDKGEVSCYEGGVPDGLGALSGLTLASGSGCALRRPDDFLCFENGEISTPNAGLVSEPLPVLFRDKLKGRCLDRKDLLTLTEGDYSSILQAEHLDNQQELLSCNSECSSSADPVKCNDECEESYEVHTEGLSEGCNTCYNTFAACAVHEKSKVSECYEQRTECIGLPIDFISPKGIAKNTSCTQDKCVNLSRVGQGCETDITCRSGSCVNLEFSDEQHTEVKVCSWSK